MHFPTTAGEIEEEERFPHTINNHHHDDDNDDDNDTTLIDERDEDNRETAEENALRNLVRAEVALDAFERSFAMPKKKPRLHADAVQDFTEKLSEELNAEAKSSERSFRETKSRDFTRNV